MAALAGAGRCSPLGWSSSLRHTLNILLNTCQRCGNPKGIPPIIWLGGRPCMPPWGGRDLSRAHHTGHVALTAAVAWWGSWPGGLLYTKLGGGFFWSAIRMALHVRDNRVPWSHVVVEHRIRFPLHRPTHALRLVPSRARGRRRPRSRRAHVRHKQEKQVVRSHVVVATAQCSPGGPPPPARISITRR